MTHRFLDILGKLIQTNARDEDVQRRSYILNILLVSFIGLALIGSITWTLTNLALGNQVSFSRVGFSVLLFFLFFLSFLLFLSKKGYASISASLLIGSLLLAVLHVTYTWGVDVDQAIIMYGLLIIFTGVLVSERSALFLYIFISTALSVIYYLHTHNYLYVNRSWKNVEFSLFDLVVLNATYAIITLVSWLYSSEIRKGLHRAKASESKIKKLASQLKKERDQLEITVEKRTQDLRKAQLERMQQLYQTVEIGRTTAGLLHDLNNPLTVITLNLDTIQDSLNQMGITKDKLADLEQSTALALQASQKINQMVTASRNQLIQTLEPTPFNPSEEIAQLATLFDFRIKRAHIDLYITGDLETRMYSYQAQFAQVIANVLSNSIDAFANSHKQKRQIKINLNRQQTDLAVQITDNGSGIKKEFLSHIFKPLFSTKHKRGGTGLGLYISKKITEEVLGGTCSLSSVFTQGTTITLKIPLHIKDYEKHHPKYQLRNRVSA